MSAVRRLLAPHASAPQPGLPPFQGGAAGYVGYDWGLTLERLPAAALRRPGAGRRGAGPLRLGDGVGPRRVEGVARLDRVAGDRPRRPRAAASGGTSRLGRRSCCEHATPPWPRRRRAASARASGDMAPSYPVEGGWWRDSLELRSSFSHRGYLDVVAKVREYIFAGDIFQANLSQRFEAPLRGAGLGVLPAPARPQPGAVCRVHGAAATRPSLSASPERFLQVDPSGHVETRPIKGTRARGFGPEHDAALGQALTESAKDRAENLMIVDLMRNDLSRVCTAGQRARVGALLARALRHRAPPGVDGRRATWRQAPTHSTCCALAFPGGSITGAPEAARHGDHRGVRAVAARCLLRLHRLLERDRRARHQHRHPHRGGCGTAAYTSVPAAASWPIPSPSRSTARRSTRRAPRSTCWQPRTPSAMTVSSLQSPVVLVLDNRDSFVYNLARYVRELGGEAVVWRSDEVSVGRRGGAGARHVIISPGRARRARPASPPTSCGGSAPPRPILGVCLGHQCIGAAYGGDIVRAPPADARQDVAHRPRRHERLRGPAVARCAWRGITRW